MSSRPFNTDAALPDSPPNVLANGIVDNGTVPVPAVGLPTQVRIDPATGALIVTSSGGGGGGVQFAEASAFTTGDKGTMALGVVDDGSVEFPAVGNYTLPRLDVSTRGLIVGPQTSQPVGGAEFGVIPLAQESSDMGSHWLPLNLDGIGNLLVSAIVTSVSGKVALETDQVVDNFVAPAIGTQTPTTGKWFAMQVKDVGGASTWDIRLEIALVGVAGPWFEIAKHTDLMPGDGGAVSGGAVPWPSLAFRANCVAIGGTASVQVYTNASQ